MWKAKSIFNDKTTVLPSKIRLLLVADGVKSLCKGMGSLLEEKLQLLRGIHRIWLIVAYVMHVRRIQKQFNFHGANIIAMEETPVWKNMVSNTTVEKTGSKEFAMESTGHDKVHVSVCLTGKANVTRLKPFIVFKRAKGETNALHDEFHRQYSVASSTNGWMNEELTLR